MQWLDRRLAEGALLAPPRVREEDVVLAAVGLAGGTQAPEPAPASEGSPWRRAARLEGLR